MEEKPKVEKPKKLEEPAVVEENNENENSLAPPASEAGGPPRSPTANEPGKSYAERNISVSALKKQANYSGGKPSKHDKAYVLFSNEKIAQFKQADAFRGNNPNSGRYQ